MSESIDHNMNLDQHHWQEKAEAAAFRRLLAHLNAHKEVQNIELMNLADFCRNCLSKWYMAEAESLGQTMDYEAARETIYGMPYSEWKEKHQLPATPEQLAIMEQKQAAKK
ncbi:DUF1244 domain-containing protein [Eionea flava]